ncbi:sugar ABC transporter permease [Cohnella kolymensis]|uniref:Sugar ABC transporter permease n=1 Tax=Cohnella kolymensis TaxID=1590652 RepID=A0ABR5A047_9BACL|nr:sugar ABC transporter permease [Cohnella kolymensis]KIL34297.1 sugar ABC transporter permease [Cohnella kolymensis]
MTPLKKRQTVTGYLFSLPWIAYFLVFMLYPLILAFKISFQKVSVTQPHKAEFVGFGNWVKVAADPVFWKSVFNVIYNQSIFISLLFVISLGLALLLKEVTKGGAIFRTLYFLPVITSVTVAIAVFIVLLGVNGPVQQLLVSIGILDKPTDWMITKWWAMPIVAIFNSWKWFAIQMIIFLGGLMTINPEIYEAAEIDGAGWWQRFWNVTIPQLKPQIVFVSTMNIINGMQMFTESLMFFGSSGGPYKAGMTPVLYLYKTGFNDMDMGYASSIGLFLMLIIVVLTTVQWKIMNRNETKA